MRKLPWRGLFIKTLAVSVWGVSSLVVFFIGIHFLVKKQGLTSDPSATTFKPSFVYSLYSAIPEKGQVLGQTILGKDLRVAILESYLAKHRSPLPADKFIEVANRYNLPWTLLPAIAGKESCFGKAIPPGSYNPFGWAVYTGQETGANFSSWEDAIEEVAKTMREKYFDKGATTPAQIEPFYTPSSLTRGNTWKTGVEFFMQQIENWR